MALGDRWRFHALAKQGRTGEERLLGLLQGALTIQFENDQLPSRLLNGVFELVYLVSTAGRPGGIEER